MLKKKVYEGTEEKELEEKINNLIINLEQEDKEIIDIKYSTSCVCDDDNQIYVFSALVMYDNKLIQKYKPKRYEIIEKVEENK